MIPLVVLFLIPTYYIARSKGYNALLLCIAVGFLSWMLPPYLRLLTGKPVLPLADITVPLLMLTAVWLVPPRKGAPGKAYLSIGVTCPECNAAVSFKRHEEGSAALCPSCGEIITVPLDEHSPKSSPRKRRRPQVMDGKVCFDSYTSEMAAYEAQALLEGNGITAEVVGSTGGGSLPHLSVDGGYKLVINSHDWDRAVEAEQQATATDIT